MWTSAKKILLRAKRPAQICPALTAAIATKDSKATATELAQVSLLTDLNVKSSTLNED